MCPGQLNSILLPDFVISVILKFLITVYLKKTAVTRQFCEVTTQAPSGVAAITQILNVEQ